MIRVYFSGTKEMDVTAVLDGFRANVVGCDLVAFADLSSKMVLCTSANTKRPQEELDSLTEVAALMISGGVAEAAAPVVGETRSEMAMTMTPSDVRVVLRAPGESEEVLICVCGAGTDMGNLVESGRATLAEITAGG